MAEIWSVFARRHTQGVQRAKPFAGVRGVPAQLPNQPPKAAQSIDVERLATN